MFAACAGCTCRSTCRLTAIEDLGPPCRRVMLKRSFQHAVLKQDDAISGLVPRASDPVAVVDGQNSVKIEACDEYSRNLDTRPKPSESRKTCARLYCSTPVTVEGRYMVDLPSDLIKFSSPEGRKLLGEAMADRSAESYFHLSEQFLTQSEPPLCGPATIAMVLNSISVDPGRIWKGPWRWFTEEMLRSCSKTIANMEQGLTMDQFSYLAECNGASVQPYFADADVGEYFFRDTVRKICSDASSTHRLVVGFSREHLGQTGTGHYSPIGAYHESTDRILVLDVARFKYPPYWVPVKDMWKSMSMIDPDTGKSRGFFILGRRKQTLCENKGMCLQGIGMSMRELSGKSIFDILVCDIPALHCGLRAYSHQLRERLANAPETIDAMFEEVQRVQLFPRVSEILAEISVNPQEAPQGIVEALNSHPQRSAEIATIMVCSINPSMCASWSAAIANEVELFRSIFGLSPLQDKIRWSPTSCHQRLVEH